MQIERILPHGLRVASMSDRPLCTMPKLEVGPSLLDKPQCPWTVTS